MAAVLITLSPLLAGDDQGMTEEQPWHSLTEAARMTGLDREAIRSRARRGLVPSRKGNRGELAVQIPAELMTGDDRGTGHPLAEEVITLRVAMADLTAEVGDLRELLARAEAERDAAESVAEAQVSAAREVVVELKAMLAEARKPWWRRWVG